MFLLKKVSFIMIFTMVLSLTLSACSKGNTNTNSSTVTESSSVDDKSIDAEAVEYAEYAGEYQDSISQRATMTATDLGDALELIVRWSSSATEVSTWSMTAKFTSPDKLSYTDCEYGITVFNNGNDAYTKEYDGGEGYFTVSDGKLLWNGAADESCKDCIFEKLDFEPVAYGNEVRHIEEPIDIYNMPDGTYPVRIFFDAMKRNGDSISLEFLIYTVIHYDPEEIRSLKQGDIIYEYVDETTTENYLIDTVNFPVDTVCVINGGSERGEGLTLSLDKSGYFIVSVNEVYTRHAAHGTVSLDVPDSVSFEDNLALANTKRSGNELYEYFNGLSDDEKDYFNENSTFITVENGKVTEFYRVYMP